LNKSTDYFPGKIKKLTNSNVENVEVIMEGEKNRTEVPGKER